MSAFVKPLHTIITTIIADDDRQLRLADIKFLKSFHKTIFGRVLSVHSSVLCYRIVTAE